MLELAIKGVGLVVAFWIILVLLGDLKRKL